MTTHSRQRQAKVMRWLMTAMVATATAIAPIVATSAAASSAEPAHQVHIGGSIGYGGTSMHPVWLTTPASGDPDAYAYCIEHDVAAQGNKDGVLGAPDTHLGANLFDDPAVQAKVFWVLAHGYPAVDLAGFGAAAGVPTISVNDAIEATQYAIWRYTELNFDASWDWASPESEAAYWYLISGANASSGMTQADFAVSVSVTAPTSAQSAGSLVGPFVIQTNQATVSVQSDPVLPFTDANGASIDTGAVVDGQEVYLDTRGSTAAGAATVTASAAGLSSTGMVISVPDGSNPVATADSHAQSMILVAPSTAQTVATATTQWSSNVPTSTFQIRKTVTGDSASLVDPETAFVVGATWDGGEQTFEVKNDGQWVTSPELPMHTTITLSELTPPSIAGVDWGAYSISCEVDTDGGWGRSRSSELNSGATIRLDDRTTSVICTLTNTAGTTPSAPEPTISTTLVDSADGDHELGWNGGTVIDTVAYQNLTPGTTYTVTGVLMDKADSTSTGITGTVTFTPAEPNGSVQVTFHVPTGHAGKVIVAYERVFEGTDTTGTPVAVHEDINDAAQTVTVSPTTPGTNPPAPGTNPPVPGTNPPVPGTNPPVPDTNPTTRGSEPTAPGTNPTAPGSEHLPATGTSVPGLALGIAGFMLLAGASFLLARRARTIDSAGPTRRR